MEGKPPFGHDSACSTEKAVPQAQLEGMLAGNQPYLRANASSYDLNTDVMVNFTMVWYYQSI